MECKRFETLIAQYVEGDLPAGKARMVERHLAVCPGCREFARGLRLSQNALKMLGHDEAPSASLDRVRAKVMRSVAGEPVRRSVYRWQFALAVAVVIAVAAAVLWHSRQSRSPVVSRIERRIATVPPQVWHRNQAESTTVHRAEVPSAQMAKRSSVHPAPGRSRSVGRRGLPQPKNSKLARRENQTKASPNYAEARISRKPSPLPAESSASGAKNPKVPAVKVKLLTNDPNIVIYLITD